MAFQKIWKTGGDTNVITVPKNIMQHFNLRTGDTLWIDWEYITRYTNNITLTSISQLDGVTEDKNNDKQTSIQSKNQRP